MKWYNQKHRNQFSEDLKRDLKLNKEERYVLQYYPLALKFARKVNCEEQKVGILNVQDIEQTAMLALLQAWESVKWDKLDDKPNWEKALINYLSSNIDGRIKRGILKEATGVNTPEYLITKTKQEDVADKLFGNWLYSFKLDDVTQKALAKSTYADIIEWTPDSSSWENDKLNDLLSTIMFKYLNDIEREVIRMSFGIDCHKSTASQIGDIINKGQYAVEKIKQRAIKKLDNTDARTILKDFL